MKENKAKRSEIKSVIRKMIRKILDWTVEGREERLGLTLPNENEGIYAS